MAPAGLPEHVNTFAKIHKALNSFARDVRHKKLGELSRLDFLGPDYTGGPDVIIRPEVIEHFNRLYPLSPKTVSSQLSLLKGLGRKDIKAAKKHREQSTTKEVEQFDVNSYLEHVKLIWLTIPRQGYGKLKCGVERSESPMTIPGRDAWKIVLTVHTRFGTTSVSELLIDRYAEIRQEVMKLNHSLRGQVLSTFDYIRKKLGLKLGAPPPRLKQDGLPLAIWFWLDNYIKRAPKGLIAIPELRALAKEYEYEYTEPQSKTTIRNNVKLLLSGLAYAELTPGTHFLDLLRLDSNTEIIKGREVVTYFNPDADKYFSALRQKDIPGWKREGFDAETSVAYKRTLCTIARFNGAFAEAEAFAEAYEFDLDKDSKSGRKSDKLTKFDREWLDAEIDRLYPLYKKTVDTKAYLVDHDSLRLVLFFPQLLTLRYLGFRQQCIRKCDVGKNIIFCPDGSVVWHYDKDEIKNQRPIHQTYSNKLHKGMKVIERLISVWKSHKKVLDTIKVNNPEWYEEKVGNAFFVRATRQNQRRNGLVRRYKRGAVEASAVDFGNRESNGSTELNYSFKRDLYRFLNCEHIRSCEFDLNVHFLRAVCCNWMVKVLGWSWEQVAKALGDKVETLKREYYHEEEFVVDASDAYAETARQMRGQERLFSTMGVETGGASQSVISIYTRSVDLLEDQFKRERERADRYEQEAKESREKIRVLEAQLAAINQPRPLAFA